jgi:hypothetical protein
MYDSNDNNWYSLQQFESNLGTQTWWVCQLLHAGPNAVTVTGLTGDDGGPNLMVLEYVPPCPLGATMIQALLPSGFMDPNPPVSAAAYFNMNKGDWYHTMVAGLYDQIEDDAARVWSVTLQSYAIRGGLRLQFTQPGSLQTGAVADSTVPKPFSLNTITFDYTPSYPPLGAGNALPTGVMISSFV